MTSFNSISVPLGTQDGMTMHFAGTDLFDDDDFDWSKLM